MEYLKQNESNKIQSMATYETPCTGNIMIIILITITWITLNHRCSENGKIIYPTKDIKIAKNKLDEMVKNEIESNNPQPSDMITDQPPNPFNIFPVVENISNSLNKNLRRKLYKLAMKHKPTVEPEISKLPEEETEDNINPTSNTIDEKEIDVTEDVMKIMTLSVIFSTPSEDMTLDPTTVKSTIKTNKTETQQIEINPEQDNPGKPTEVENNSIPIMQQVKQRIRQLEKIEAKHNIPPPPSTKRINRTIRTSAEPFKKLSDTEEHNPIKPKIYTKQEKEKWLKERYQFLSGIEDTYEEVRKLTPHLKKTTDIIWHTPILNNYLEVMTHITSQRIMLACQSYKFTQEKEGKPFNLRDWENRSKRREPRNLENVRLY